MLASLLTPSPNITSSTVQTVELLGRKDYRASGYYRYDLAQPATAYPL